MLEEDGSTCCFVIQGNALGILAWNSSLAADEFFKRYFAADARFYWDRGDAFWD